MSATSPAPQAISRELQKQIDRQITVDGVVYPNLFSACRERDMKYQTVRSRLVGGWTPDEAFEVVVRRRVPYDNKRVSARIERPKMMVK